MSMVLGYISIIIVAIIFTYVMGSAMLHQWKDDKKSFMVSLGLVLALVLGITGLVLKGMGL
ncbi:hypothetical protein [Mammaliicoccus phage vB_MscM-PMS3]|nr:hypothetical protein [Mammaliicoccus phage vB_MscM-PMS3]WBF82259.1 hypothetical protein [Mammaliicoccus virus vB_MscM-PMS2]